MRKVLIFALLAAVAIGAQAEEAPGLITARVTQAELQGRKQAKAGDGLIIVEILPTDSVRYERRQLTTYDIPVFYWNDHPCTITEARYAARDVRYVIIDTRRMFTLFGEAYAKRYPSQKE